MFLFMSAKLCRLRLKSQQRLRNKYFFGPEQLRILRLCMPCKSSGVRRRTMHLECFEKTAEQMREDHFRREDLMKMTMAMIGIVLVLTSTQSYSQESAGQNRELPEVERGTTQPQADAILQELRSIRQLLANQ